MRTIHCSGRLSCHACPPPCMPPAMHAPLPPTMHAPLHACPHHACPWPCMPAAMHAPYPPTCMSPCHACPPHPPVNRVTDTCKNITFPQFCLQTVNMYLERVVESLEQTDVLYYKPWGSCRKPQTDQCACITNLEGVVESLKQTNVPVLQTLRELWKASNRPMCLYYKPWGSCRRPQTDWHACITNLEGVVEGLEQTNVLVLQTLREL